MESIGRRRRFLTTTTAGLAGILAARVPAARGQQREISYLCWNNFAPAMEKKQNATAQRFPRDTQIKLRIAYTPHPQQPAKYAAEAQPQAAHDLVEMRMHFPWLYEPQLTDVSDLVAELEKKHGKTLSSGYEAAHVNGVWRAVPMYHGLFVPTYREDLFKRAGLKVPDTWEELYTVGKELKKMGHPVGIPISQNYDSISTAGPGLWGLGGLEVDKDGKTVRINAPATQNTIEGDKKKDRARMEPAGVSGGDARHKDNPHAGQSALVH